MKERWAHCPVCYFRSAVTGQKLISTFAVKKGHCLTFTFMHHLSLCINVHLFYRIIETSVLHAFTLLIQLWQFITQLIENVCSWCCKCPDVQKRHHHVSVLLRNKYKPHYLYGYQFCRPTSLMRDTYGQTLTDAVTEWKLECCNRKLF